MPWRVLALVCLTLGLTASVSTVRAMDVSFRAPEGCGSSAELEARLKAMQGAAAERAHAQIDIEAIPGAFRLRAALDGTTRTVEDASCRVVFESALVMVALSVDPARARELPSTPLSAPEPARADALVPPPRGKTLRMALWLEAGALHGVVPSWDASVGLGAALVRNWVGASFRLRYAPPRADEHVSVQAAGTRLLALFVAPARVWLGAGLEGDLLVGQGRSLDVNRRDTITRGAACMELGVDIVSRGAHRLSLVADLALALHQAAFRARRDTAGLPQYYSVYRPERWAFGAALRWHLQTD